MMNRFYRQDAAHTSGSARNHAFSASLSAALRLLNDDVPRDAEILVNLIEPEVMKRAVSSYDLGTGPVSKRLLNAAHVEAVVAAAVEKALEVFNPKWFNLKQAAAASTATPLVLEDPALAGLSAAQIAKIKQVKPRTVYRWRAALKAATQAERKRWTRVGVIRRDMTNTLRRYKRYRDTEAKPRPERRTLPTFVMGTQPSAEKMNLLSPPPRKTYPKMTFAGMLASLGPNAP
jgi:hypothetical protein